MREEELEAWNFVTIYKTLTVMHFSSFTVSTVKIQTALNVT